MAQNEVRDLIDAVKQVVSPDDVHANTIRRLLATPGVDINRQESTSRSVRQLMEACAADTDDGEDKELPRDAFICIELFEFIRIDTINTTNTFHSFDKISCYSGKKFVHIITDLQSIMAQFICYPKHYFGVRLRFIAIS